RGAPRAPRIAEPPSFPRAGTAPIADAPIRRPDARIRAEDRDQAPDQRAEAETHVQQGVHSCPDLQPLRRRGFGYRQRLADGARGRARSPSGHRERLLSTISHTLCGAGPSPPRALDARGLPVSEAATRAFAATLGRNASKNVSFGPIEQRTTPGSVAHVLRTAILDGTLAP